MKLRTKNRVLFAAAALLIPTALVGCSAGGGGDALTNFLNKDQITLAVSGAAPASFLSTDGSAAGIEPEVAVAVLQAMGIADDKITATQVSFSALIPGLEAGQFDMLAGAQFMNQTRCATVLFSEPIYVVGYSLAYKTGLSPEPTSLAEVVASDMMIGVVSGTVQERALIAEGVPTNRILAVENYQSTVDALRADRVDVVFGVEIQMAEIIGNDSSLTISPHVPEMANSGSGVIFKKGQEAVRDEFNKHLKALQESGKFQEISEKYGVDPNLAINATTEELCKNEG